MDFFFLKSNNNLKDDIIKEIKKSYEGTEDDLMNNIEQNRGYQLISRLAELGDKEAQEMLKKEITNRLKTGDVWVLSAFINMDDMNEFLKVLNDTQLESIVHIIRSKLDKETQEIFNKLERIAQKDFEKLTDRSLLDKEELEKIIEIEDQIGAVDFLASGLPAYSDKRKMLLFFLIVLLVLNPFNE